MALLSLDEPPRLVNGLLSFDMCDTSGRAVLVQVDAVVLQMIREKHAWGSLHARRRLERIARFKHIGGKFEYNGTILIGRADLDVT